MTFRWPSKRRRPFKAAVALVFRTMEIGGVVFITDGTGVLCCWALLPLVSVLLVFGTLVGWSCSEVGSGLVDFFEDQDPMFSQCVVIFLVCGGNDDRAVEFSNPLSAMRHIFGFGGNFRHGVLKSELSLEICHSICIVWLFFDPDTMDGNLLVCLLLVHMEILRVGLSVLFLFNSYCIVSGLTSTRPARLTTNNSADLAIPSQLLEV